MPLVVATFRSPLLQTLSITKSTHTQLSATVNLTFDVEIEDHVPSVVDKEWDERKITIFDASLDEEKDEDEPHTPIKSHKHMESPPRRESSESGHHRYMIQSSPSPRISGVNNSVSRYHPNQRVSLRFTPFPRRVEEEMSREEMTLEKIRRRR